MIERNPTFIKLIVFYYYFFCVSVLSLKTALTIFLRLIVQGFGLISGGYEITKENQTHYIIVN